jgi:hypothetical protein
MTELEQLKAENEKLSEELQALRDAGVPQTRERIAWDAYLAGAGIDVSDYASAEPELVGLEEHEAKFNEWWKKYSNFVPIPALVVH